MLPHIADVRASLKFSGRHPLTTLTAILVMSLGLGVSVSMFTLVNGLMWSGIDTPGDSKVVSLRWNDRRNPDWRQWVHVRDFRVIREEATSFDMVGAISMQETTFGDIDGQALPRRYAAARVTDNFFQMWGATPILGRGFNPGEGLEEGNTTVLISYRVWQNNYGGTADVIGKQVYFNGTPRVIRGVMPEGFNLPIRQDLWVPTEWQASDGRKRENAPRVWVIGRLKPGVSIKACENEINVFADRFAEAFPGTNENFISSRIEIYDQTFLDGGTRNLLLIMLTCAILVLIISCANVSNLIMGRAADRSTEMSIRSALGASRHHILALIILDSMMVSLFGSIGGIGLAHGMNTAIWNQLEELDLPSWWHMDPDWKVVAFVIGIVAFSGIASGLIPGLRASRSNTAQNLRDDTRTGSNLYLGKLSQFLIGVQVALSCALLVAGTSMALIYGIIQSMDFPFETKEVLTAQFNVPDTQIENNEEVLYFYEELQENLLQNGEVLDATLSTSWRGIGNWNARIEIEGRPADSEEEAEPVNWVRVFDNYFDFFNIPVTNGRAFQPTDTKDNRRVAVINQSFVQAYFPDENPMGKRFRFYNPEEAEADNWFYIVGTCPDYWPEPLPNDDAEDAIVFYAPYRQDPNRWQNIHLKGRIEPMALTPILRRTIFEMVPTQAAYDIMTVEKARQSNFGGLSIVVSLFLLFGFGALFLAGVGLFAVSAFKARQLYREIGIRIALGASSSQIIRFMVRQGAWFILAGLLLGLSIGSVIAKGIENTINLYMPLGWETWAIIIASILGIYGVAVGSPAYQASRTNPAITLKSK